MTQPITYSKVPAQEVAKAVEAMEASVATVSDQVVMMACFALAIAIAFPDIENKDLADGIKGASEWLALFIDNLVDPPTKQVMN
jgi:hypothetical protein